MDKYSIFCEDEMGSFEVNSYLLTQKEAFKMASDLFAEGNEEVTIVNMEMHIKSKEY